MLLLVRFFHITNRNKFKRTCCTTKGDKSWEVSCQVAKLQSLIMLLRGTGGRLGRSRNFPKGKLSIWFLRFCSAVLKSSRSKVLSKTGKSPVFSNVFQPAKFSSLPRQTARRRSQGPRMSSMFPSIPISSVMVSMFRVRRRSRRRSWSTRW